MNEPNRPPNRPPGRLKRLLGLALIVLLLVAVWHWLLPHRFDWTLFSSTFNKMHPLWLGAAACLALSTFFGRAVRWQVMIHHMKPDTSLARLTWATCIGFSASVLMGRAGEFVRPYLIARDQGLSMSSQLAAWSLERLTDLIAVLVIFGIALGNLEGSVAAQVGPQIRWVLESGGKLIALIGGLSLFLLIAFRSFSGASTRRIMDAVSFLPEAFQQRVGNFFDAFARGMEATRNGRTLTLILVLSLVEWALIEACYYCVFKSFPATESLSMMDTLVVLGFVSFGSIVQIPGVGGGMQVVTVIVLTQIYGVSVEHATALAMVLWVIGFAIIVPLGIILAIRSHLHWKDLREQV